jgi:hypothetical protein
MSVVHHAVDEDWTIIRVRSAGSLRASRALVRLSTSPPAALCLAMAIPPPSAGRQLDDFCTDRFATFRRRGVKWL